MGRLQPQEVLRLPGEQLSHPAKLTRVAAPHTITSFTPRPCSSRMSAGSGKSTARGGLCACQTTNASATSSSQHLLTNSPRACRTHNQTPQLQPATTGPHLPAGIQPLLVPHHLSGVSPSQRFSTPGTNHRHLGITPTFQQGVQPFLAPHHLSRDHHYERAAAVARNIGRCHVQEAHKQAAKKGRAC